MQGYWGVVAVWLVLLCVHGLLARAAGAKRRADLKAHRSRSDCRRARRFRIRLAAAEATSAPHAAPALPRATTCGTRREVAVKKAIAEAQGKETKNPAEHDANDSRIERSAVLLLAGDPLSQ